MKLIRLIIVVAFLGISTSVALADGVPTDPTLLTSGCGRLGQPKCDAYLISSPMQTMMVRLTLDTTVGDPFFGDAIADFVNVSGRTLDGLFTVSFIVPAGLSFQGCSVQEGITSLFACTGGGSPDSPITGGGTAAFNLFGASICSVDFDDLGGGSEGAPITYVSDNDDDDNCQAAFRLALKPVAGETLPSFIDGNFSSAPEPSSAVLLLFGLAACLLTLKGLRTNLA